MIKIIMSIAALVIVLTGAVILMMSGRSTEGYVHTSARLLDVMLGDMAGHVVPIVELQLGGAPRRAVCREIPRTKLNAQKGDMINVVYSPRGENGFANLMADPTGDAIQGNAKMLKLAGALMIVVGAVFLVLAVVIKTR